MSQHVLQHLMDQLGAFQTLKTILIGEKNKKVVSFATFLLPEEILDDVLEVVLVVVVK